MFQSNNRPNELFQPYDQDLRQIDFSCIWLGWWTQRIPFGSLFGPSIHDFYGSHIAGASAVLRLNQHSISFAFSHPNEVHRLYRTWVMAEHGLCANAEINKNLWVVLSISFNSNHLPRFQRKNTKIIVKSFFKNFFEHVSMKLLTLMRLWMVSNHLYTERYSLFSPVLFSRLNKLKMVSNRITVINLSRIISLRLFIFEWNVTVTIALNQSLIRYNIHICIYLTDWVNWNILESSGQYYWLSNFNIDSFSFIFCKFYIKFFSFLQNWAKNIIKQ